MSCKTTAKYLEAHLDDALEQGARAELEAHLATCLACARRARGERHVRARLAEALREPVPAGLRARVEAVVRDDAAVVPLRRLDPWVEAEARLEDAPPSANDRRAPGLAWRAAALSLAAGLAAVVGLSVLTSGPSVADAWATDLARDHAGHHGAGGIERLVPASSPAELERWFGARGIAVEVPPAPPGGRLVGGQVCDVNGEFVAHVVYALGDDGTVSRFTLPRIPGPDRAVDGQVESLHYVGWDTPAGGVFVLGDVGPAALARAFPPG